MSLGNIEHKLNKLIPIWIHLLGFFMGILQVRISHTVPIPANTIPITGMGTYHTVIHVVSDETCGILIIKITIITIIITSLKYYTKNERGGGYMRWWLLIFTK